MSMTRQEKIDYQAQWRWNHGIKPRGSVKGRKVGKRRPIKLAEMSPYAMMHLTTEKFLRAIEGKIKIRKGE